MKWIPVSERLPEEHREDDFNTVSNLVLVTVKDHDSDKLIVSDDITLNGEWVNFDTVYFEVLAWQPLPEPYKGEGEV